MSIPLTPDEETVFREFLRLDVEPNQIPVELFEGFMERLAASCNMSVRRARIATEGLIGKGVFDTGGESDEDVPAERAMVRDLILHDPEIQEHLRTMIAEICQKKP